MPTYEYNRDYPFAAFITNLGKYNEGELIGEWVKFPTTAEEIKAAMDSIGIGQKDDFGYAYEEWFITDYDCYVDGLYDKLGEYVNLDELNYLASKLDEMSQSEYEQFQAAMSVGDHSGSLQDMINLTENLDCYEVNPNITDYDDLGRYYIDELEAMQVPDYLENYIDYEAYGRDVALDEDGQFTDYGYVRDTGDSFVEVYDGNPENIPEEYRIMSVPEEDLSKEEIEEWAADIAHDMDALFRQEYPQYAAAFPNSQKAWPDIQEKLLAGRIADYSEKLESLGQKATDYLPSELEKFKEATGYEEWLDFDPEAVREGLENPDKSRIDEMLAFAEKAEREYAAAAAAYEQTPADIAEQARAVYGELEKMTVLVVEPLKEPYVKQIAPGYRSMQAEVDGAFQAIYPYDDPVALVCNDEGKLMGMDLNRGLRDNTGNLYDIVAGTFLVVGLGEEDFASLSPELIQKYTEQFRTPELFVPRDGKLVVLPVPEQDQEKAYLPDKFETGGHVQTPRGNFCVTALSQKQMEALGYGVHHHSDDRRFLIMGNGTRAFAVAADPRDLERPSIRDRLETARQECAKQPMMDTPSRDTSEREER